MEYILSNRIKSQLIKIFWITIGWTLISLGQYCSTYLTLLALDCDLHGVSPFIPLLGSLLTGILAGIVGGSFVVFLWEKWLRSREYGWTLISIMISYTIIFIVVAVPTGIYSLAARAGKHLFDPDVVLTVLVNLFSLRMLFNYIFWFAVILLTLIILLVNDKYGPGVFRDFLLGKYFQPKREERIFMFLDLRSSTEIAERLGEAQYFNFLKQVFEDATPGILYSSGEIYQYVGDEIVVSWKTERGVYNANCLRCFFEIERMLKGRREMYVEKYGVYPEFKAGFHYGNVMAGEIGVIKRDIAYSGDVLNTTSRIQSKCNELGVNILLSKLLLDKLSLPPNLYNPKRIGQMLLRGKKMEIALYTI